MKTQKCASGRGVLNPWQGYPRGEYLLIMIIIYSNYLTASEAQPDMSLGSARVGGDP